MAEITLEQARTIIDTALEYGGTRALKPLSVIVLDAGGNCRAFARSDGASPGRFEIAHGKAYGAVMLGMPSSKLKQRAEAEAYFVAAANGAFQGKLIPVAGGVLVRDNNGAAWARSASPATRRKMMHWQRQPGSKPLVWSLRRKSPSVCTRRQQSICVGTCVIPRQCPRLPSIEDHPD